MALANLILTGLQDIQATRYAQLASSAIIIFDHVITLDEEKSSWSMGKVLFVINRYYTLISVVPTLTDSVSLGFFRWQGWTGLIACMIAEVILQMRLYALYFLNKKVLALMVATFIVSSASSAVIMGKVLSGITARSLALSLPGKNVIFCVPSGVPDYFFAFWVPIIGFESLLCGLALYRGFQTFRASGSPFQSGRHLVAILIRDSVLYFLVMFATYFTNLLVWASAPTNLLEIPIAFSVALSCCLGNRMILNVREVNREIVQSKVQSNDTIRHQSKQQTSFFGPAEQLTDIEMAQLRSMRVDEQNYGPFIVL
ncbi:hypothetical protein B0H17DRAFT_1063959 [Mycena rosella]|uniref:DUF6533 domain-containing protein n=1 Tax=Mycena rosella TaxID=1033263 RepID=A0AAD7DGW4_MYCRO|nr:hypothetical protein B0H17DRAFT_1063959 [Mycena rosella]